jgi:beta-aspartyl-peptidase (threonine type)
MTRSIIVHGGAWDIPDDEVDAHMMGCRIARDVGWQVLLQGGSALDAVEAAVRSMEDDPAFDAGVGSVLNADGVVELDAAMMDGQTLRSGAVAAVQRVRNPITLARRVLESDVILLVGSGAERFAQQVHIPLCDPTELIIDRERRRWETLRHQRDFRTEHAFTNAEVAKQQETIAASVRLDYPRDTVGAVVIDQEGRIAAATSTGGTPNKLPGRVGDSPLIGCGLYADMRTGGCSSTGWGESIIKVLLAKTATDLLTQERDPMAAARAAIDVLAQRVRGLGGCILLDSQGRVGFAYNTPRMAYAYRTEDGQEAVGV